MIRLIIAGLAACLASMALAGNAAASAARSPDAARWERRAQAVEIIRDSWGIAHVHGKSDADAVFGAMYAQAEDDFHRIEHNYLVALGRLALAEGEQKIYNDLRQRLFTDPEKLERAYRQSPQWLKSLMEAWADGLNYYLKTHPQVSPAVITHFEPWMALSFTEGSIGGDIETIDLAALAQMYPAPAASLSSLGPIESRSADLTEGGSNGFAIAPSRSARGHAMLWINPHTSFYFRAEIQMSSEEGLDVYGAVTWGQFFVYQGFNSRNGWMHTSYGGDAIDEYAETIVPKNDGLYYKYGGALRRLQTRRVDLEIKGSVGKRSFVAYFSHHGPIVRREHGQWIAVRMLNDPVHALAQSYLRTKTVDYASFRKTQEMRTDTSNNTVYADADGTIAYFHGNFIPRRDARFDFTHPVDGSDPATEWHGVHDLDETITLLNPPNGWIQNTNNWPFSAAGADSPKRERYPAYMWTKGENPRGVHAVELLRDIHDVTLESLIQTAYDSHLTAFDTLLPPLFGAFDRLPADDPRRVALNEPIAALRGWDRRTAAGSAPTALAIFWGQYLMDQMSGAARAADQAPYDFLVDHLSDSERLDALSRAVARLSRDFGRWLTPWGEINRFQRLTDDIVPVFDDAKDSLPIGFAPSKWGALASFDSTSPRSTKRIYGTTGNSFVAAVEFGPTVRAKAIMTGGQSGDPASPHFTDQAIMYSEGRLRDVFFTPEDVSAHAVRRYRPGAP